MNIYQKCTINSTKITVAPIYSQWTTVQISDHLDMYINLYEKTNGYYNNHVRARETYISLIQQPKLRKF
jgi:hypothetical protein